MSELILGLVTGILFGVLLQKGRVLRFEKQVGAMLLKDMTIFKFMLSAIIVGMVGLHLFADLGLIEFKVKATHVGANLVGGILFGLGWAMVGYCPGTSVGALGEGRGHAFWAVLGMLVGAAVYAEAYPLMKQTVLTWGALGKITLDQVLGIGPWFLILLLSAAFAALFWLFERRKL